MSVDIEVKYGNREYPRIITLKGESFDRVKDAVKATGAKWNPATKRWQVPAKAYKDLAAQFEAVRRDFYVEPRGNHVIFTASGDFIWSPPGVVDGLPADSRLFAEQAREIRDYLQSLYDKSDEAFAGVLNDSGKYVA